MYLQYMTQVHATISINQKVKDDTMHFVKYNGLSFSELIEKLLVVHLKTHAADKVKGAKK